MMPYRLLEKAATMGRRRVFGLLLLPNVIFFAVAWATPATGLINVLNAVQLSLAIGVCVAYGSAVFEILTGKGPMETAEVLILGIFTAWASLTMRTVFSIAWRFYGQPIGWQNTDFTSYFLFMSCCGAAFHMAAPHSIDRYVPTKRWITIGLIAAITVLGVLLFSYALDFPVQLRRP